MLFSCPGLLPHVSSKQVGLSAVHKELGQWTAEELGQWTAEELGQWTAEELSLVITQTDKKLENIMKFLSTNQS